jgi:hypothetical protein
MRYRKIKFLKDGKEYYGHVTKAGTEFFDEAGYVNDEEGTYLEVKAHGVSETHKIGVDVEVSKEEYCSECRQVIKD